MLRIPEDTTRRSINPEMLYRYCGEIMIFPAGASWAIFRLRANGATGRRLDQGSPRMVEPGYYVILYRGKHAPLFLMIAIASFLQEV